MRRAAAPGGYFPSLIALNSVRDSEMGRKRWMHAILGLFLPPPRWALTSASSFVSVNEVLMFHSFWVILTDAVTYIGSIPADQVFSQLIQTVEVVT